MITRVNSRLDSCLIILNVTFTLVSAPPAACKTTITENTSLLSGPRGKLTVAWLIVNAKIY